MKFKIYLFISFSILCFTLLSCGSHEGHDHAEEATTEKHEDEIFFSTEQAREIGLMTETIKPSSFSQSIKTSGQILPAQGDEVTIVAPSNGVIIYSGNIMSDGASVNPKSALCYISSKNIMDGDPATVARIEYETAKSDFDRASNLVTDNIISQNEFNQVRARYETASAAYSAIKGKIGPAGVAVNSPISGYLKSRIVGEGEYVTVGQAIAVVSQNKRLQLRADVSERYFEQLASIKSANFRLPYSDNLFKLSDLDGRILSYGRSSTNNSFYVPVTFSFNNSGNIIPGSFVEIFLLSAPKENVISVPEGAITEEHGLYFVYIQQEEEGYKKQEVTLGQSNGSRVEILSGLNGGENVVVKGAYQVKLAASGSSLPEGHSH